MLHAFPHDTQANSQYKEGILDFEIRLLLRCADGRVYRRRNERFSANCIQEVDRLGGRIVIMWAAISHTGKTNLVHINENLTAQRYCDEILQPHVLPIMQNNDSTFQQDYTIPHISGVITAFLQRNNIMVRPWPSKSPDLNLIEHLMDELDKRIRQRQPAVQSLPHLVHTLQAEWVNIPQQFIQNLTSTMGRRC